MMPLRCRRRPSLSQLTAFKAPISYGFGLSSPIRAGGWAVVGAAGVQWLFSVAGGAAVVGSGGAYPAGGVGSLDWLIKDLYLCPNVKSDMTDVFINAGPARPFLKAGVYLYSRATGRVTAVVIPGVNADEVPAIALCRIR